MPRAPRRLPEVSPVPYTQESGVDEFDAVRYDGEHLFVAPRRYLNCCFILDNVASDTAANTGNAPQQSIRILATDPVNWRRRLFNPVFR